MQTIDRIQRQPKTRANQGMAALYWVSLASRPLSVTEISHALAVRTDSAKNPFAINRICSRNTLLACCMGLVIIDEETSTVRLVHYSLQEFLQNDNEPEVSLFHIHTGHGLIARTCLTYLRFCQSMTLEMAVSCECQKRYGGKKIRWEVSCTCQSEFPLFKYASSEWGNHVREGYDTSIRSLAVEWLTAKETASCPCAMIYMSLAREKYRSGFYPINWCRYGSGIGMGAGQQPHHSLLALHCIAYFGEQHILEEMVTTVGQLELNVKDQHGWTPLTWAAVRGYDLCVKQLLKYKETEVDTVDALGLTPLMHAAWHGNTKVVKQLLAPNSSQRVNLNAYGRNGRTAISYAAGRGHCAVIGILLREAEVDPNSRCISSKTPLMYATQEGMTNAAKALLSDHRVNPTLEERYGDTPLHLAVKARAVGVLKLLLRDPRVDPNHEIRDGHTPLALAARYGHTEAVKLLLGNPRVNPNHENSVGYTPLAIAARYRHAEAVKLLLGNPRVDPNHENRDGYTPLAFAARCGHADVVGLLLGNPRVDPNHESRDSYTPLALSAKSGHAEAVKLLLGDPRVDPNHEDREGYTLLALSAKYGHTQAIKVLLGDLRVNPNHNCRDGYTPLALAAKCGNAKAVKVLLGDPRVDPNPIHRTGDTPLLISIKEYLCGGHYSRYSIDALLTHPQVDRNVTDSGGRTALSYLVAGEFWLYSLWPSSPAPQGVDIEVVKSLLEGSGGADPNIRDNEGKTALDWALSVNLRNSDKCRELLQKYMSPPPQAGDVVNNINKRKTPSPGDSAPAKYPKGWSENIQLWGSCSG